MNARLEGFAKEQLSQGKGTMWIVRDLVRLGHLDEEAARAIVEHARPALLARPKRSGRRRLLLGLMTMSIPLFVVVPLIFDVVVLFGGSSLLWPRLREALTPLLTAPMLTCGIIGFAFAASGWSAMRHPKGSIEPDVPRGPVRTGLWWRADPFEWK